MPTVPKYQPDLLKPPSPADFVKLMDWPPWQREILDVVTERAKTIENFRNFFYGSNPTRSSWLTTRFKAFERLTLEQAVQRVKDERMTNWLAGVYDVTAWQLEGGSA